MKVHGGILSLLAGLALQALPFITGSVLPALGVGALSSLTSTGVQKLMGNGLYIKQEAQLMLTTGSTRLAVSRDQQTWYHSTCYI